MFQDIIDSLKFSSEFEGEEADFSGIKHNSFPFSNSYFHELRKEAKGSIVFIDGGNSEILKAPNFSLQQCRVAYVVFENNKRIKQDRKEFFVLVSVEKGKFVARTFGEDINLEFDINDDSFMSGKSQGTPSSVVLAIRRFAELKLASSLDYNTIVLDGSLQQNYSFENDFFNKLKDKNLIGFCKTSRILTKKGNSVIALMNLHKGEFVYHPVAELFDDNYKANVCFVRLHKDSKYVFKLDFQNKLDEIAISLLAENSKDPVFLGYPYGLVIADKLARVSNDEKEYMKTKLLSKIKNDDLLRYVNVLNAHDVLDNI